MEWPHKAVGFYLVNTSFFVYFSVLFSRFRKVLFRYTIPLCLSSAAASFLAVNVLLCYISVSSYTREYYRHFYV